MNRKMKIGVNICFLASFFFAAQVSAQQCIQLFSDVASTPNYQQMFSDISAALVTTDSQFKTLYRELHTAESQRERNQVVLKIVETNNSLLDMFDFITADHQLSVLPNGQEIQSRLLKNLVQLFIKQGMRSELIDAIVQSRTHFLNRENREYEKTSIPIGFVQAESKELSSPSQRTIGFQGQKLESELYGRKKDQHLETDRRLVSKNPIGFIRPSESQSTVKTGKSIGFVQKDEGVDVSFQVTLGFDISQAIFIGVSNRPPIGF